MRSPPSPCSSGPRRADAAAPCARSLCILAVGRSAAIARPPTRRRPPSPLLPPPHLPGPRPAPSPWPTKHKPPPPPPLPSPSVWLLAARAPPKERPAAGVARLRGAPLPGRRSPRRPSRSRQAPTTPRPKTSRSRPVALAPSCRGSKRRRASPSTACQSSCPTARRCPRPAPPLSPRRRSWRRKGRVRQTSRSPTLHSPLTPPRAGRRQHQPKVPCGGARGDGCQPEAQHEGRGGQDQEDEGAGHNFLWTMFGASV